MLVHYIFVNSLYHVGKHVSKNGYVKKLEGNFSAEKSKIWGGYYDPPYSAECQIKKKSGLKSYLPRV